MKKTVDEQDEQAEVMIRLAGTIALLRQRERMSIREFAKKAGINHSDLFRLENGNTRNPSVFLVRKLAKAFGMSVDELMNFEVQNCPTCHGAGWIKGK